MAGIITVLAMLTLLPQFFVKYPALIDDGVDLLYVRTNGVGRIFLDQVIVDERTRPVRYLFHKLIYEVFRLNIGFHFAIQALLLAIISILVYLVLKRLNVRHSMAFLASIFLLC